MNQILSYRWLRILVYIILSIYVISVGVIIEPDTMSYVGFSLITPPGYGTFLFVFRKLFGEDHYYHVIVLIQLIFAFSACWFLTATLQKKFLINAGLLVLIDVALLSPVFVSEYLIVNRIVTQGLAYPCFLMFTAFLIKYLFHKKNRDLALLLITVFVGICIRTQFFFLIPVLLVIFGYQWYGKKYNKQYIIAIVTVILIPVLVSVVQKTFNYVVYTKYIDSPSTGLQLIVMPFFVADAEDYLIYDSPKIQEYYKEMYQIATDRKLLDDFYVPFNDNVFHHFNYNYAHISYGVLSKEGRRLINPLAPDSPEALIENDKILKEMWLPLFYDNFWKYLDLFYKNVEHAFGGFYMIWLSLLILISSLHFFLKYKNKLMLFFLVCMLLTFSNIFLICIVQHSIGRYLIYHQWMLPVLFVLLLNWANRRFTDANV